MAQGKQQSREFLLCYFPLRLPSNIYININGRGNSRRDLVEHGRENIHLCFRFIIFLARTFKYAYIHNWKGG